MPTYYYNPDLLADESYDSDEIEYDMVYKQNNFDSFNGKSRFKARCLSGGEEAYNPNYRTDKKNRFYMIKYRDACHEGIPDPCGKEYEANADKTKHLISCHGDSAADNVMNMLTQRSPVFGEEFWNYYQRGPEEGRMRNPRYEFPDVDSTFGHKCANSNLAGQRGKTSFDRGGVPTILNSILNTNIPGVWTPTTVPGGTLPVGAFEEGTIEPPPGWNKAFIPVKVGEKGARLSSLYGPRPKVKKGRKFHPGLDFAIGQGYPIRPIFDGVVVFSGLNGGFGNHIRVYHEKQDLVTSYSHMYQPSTYKVGDSVKTSDSIGIVGSTGVSTGNHLHFEVWLSKSGYKLDLTNPDASKLRSEIRKNFKAQNPFTDPMLDILGWVIINPKKLGRRPWPFRTVGYKK